MKALLVAEYRDGILLSSVYELLGFAQEISADAALFPVGNKDALPVCDNKVYFADSSKYQEYNPQIHKDLLLDAIEQEQPDLVVFSHSSYGWDLAPRIALNLDATQISEVVGVQDGEYIVPACNAKLRRTLKSLSKQTVLTLQSGAFNSFGEDSDGQPVIIDVDTEAASSISFEGYEAADIGGVDLSKAGVIVSAGRGIGKPENVSMISALAKALGGEYGASRPVVDSEWVEHNRQVGTTGQSVAPKLYVACGISGAIQHLAGMKKSEFVVAVNTDRDAPIGEIADVLILADLKEFVPALTAQLSSG